MRTGDLARRLVAAGYEVVWWTSRFNHNLKSFRAHPTVWCEVEPGLRLALLDGPGYARNMSWQRMRHYRALAIHFLDLADRMPVPALVVGSYPSPELCDAGRAYARAHGVPFLIDIRDPWPDMFPDYLPAALRWVTSPILLHYRRIMRSVARDADSIVAVSNAMLDWGVGYARRQRTARDRVFHIGFGRNTSERRIDVPAAFTPEEPLTCLFATTCGVSYDGELLADAARILERQGERRVLFVVTGDGDRRPRWIARAAGLHTLRFTGWISNEDMQSWFRRAHLGLVLMRGGITRFWLGNKIFEYLSASQAIVNNLPGESAALVTQGGFGVNVEARNPENLAVALSSLIDDPQRVAGYMEAARREFASRFDREVIQQQYVAHLGSLLRS